MAVTIHQNPQKFATASNPVVFTFSSDETAQDNFSYIVEVYINASLHSTHQIFQQSGIYAKFNTSEINRALLSSPLITDGSLINVYSDAFDALYLIVYEQYGDPVAIEASAQTNQITVFNGALRHQEFINWDYEDYNVSTENPQGSGILYLTSFPRDRKYFCGLLERMFLGFISDDTSLRVDIRLYNAADGLIVSSLGNVITYQKLTVLDVSPQTIIDNTAITSGNFSTCAYYTVRSNGNGSGPTPGRSEVFRIDIDNECQQYETRRLHWLNKFGVWDSFTFSLVSIESTTVEGNTYSREKGIWNDDQYEYNLYRGELTTFSKKAEDTLIINSDFIHQSVQQWLVRECYESPNVYLETADGFEPVNIVNKDYTLKQKRKDGLIQEQVTIKKTYSYNTQLN